MCTGFAFLNFSFCFFAFCFFRVASSPRLCARVLFFLPLCILAFLFLRVLIPPPGCVPGSCLFVFCVFCFCLSICLCFASSSRLCARVLFLLRCWLAFLPVYFVVFCFVFSCACGVLPVVCVFYDLLGVFDMCEHGLICVGFRIV